jgi:hypothetical protein
VKHLLERCAATVLVAAIAVPAGLSACDGKPPASPMGNEVLSSQPGTAAALPAPALPASPGAGGIEHGAQTRAATKAGPQRAVLPSEPIVGERL